MLRLDLATEPRWLALEPGVEVQLAPMHHGIWLAAMASDAAIAADTDRIFTPSLSAANIIMFHHHAASDHNWPPDQIGDNTSAGNCPFPYRFNLGGTFTRFTGSGNVAMILHHQLQQRLRSQLDRSDLLGRQIQPERGHHHQNGADRHPNLACILERDHQNSPFA